MNWSGHFFVNCFGFPIMYEKFQWDSTSFSAVVLETLMGGTGSSVSGWCLFTFSETFPTYIFNCKHKLSIFCCHLLVIAIFNQPYTIFLQLIAGMPSKAEQRRRRKKELYAIKAGKGEQWRIMCMFLIYKTVVCWINYMKLLSSFMLNTWILSE